MLKPEGRLIAPTICQGEFLKHKLMMTVFKLFTGFPVFHKFSIAELSNVIEESEFVIVNKEIIQDTFPIAYIVAELNNTSKK